MGLLVDCASGASAERLTRIEREAITTLLGNAINMPKFDLCDFLGVVDLGDEFRADLQTDVPVMLVSGSLDPRTPVSNAEQVLIGLVKGDHLIKLPSSSSTMEHWRQRASVPHLVLPRSNRHEVSRELMVVLGE